MLLYGMTSGKVKQGGSRSSRPGNEAPSRSVTGGATEDVMCRSQAPGAHFSSQLQLRGKTLGSFPAAPFPQPAVFLLWPIADIDWPQECPREVDVEPPPAVQSPLQIGVRLL